MLINNLHETKNDLLAFHLVTGFRTALFDIDEKELFSCSYELCEFCHLMHSNPKSKALCLKCDKNAFDEANNTGRSHLYGCPFGLFEAVVPLIMDNTVTGYLMIGQMALDGEETSDRIKSLSLEYVEDKNALLKCIEDIPRISLERLYASVSLLEISANHIVNQGWLKPNKDTLPLQIKEFIDREFTKNVNIDIICKYTSYSRTYVIKAFTNEYGMSITKYIEKKRLELALEMLKTSNKSISQIALYCGFNDQYYFSKVFKKTFNISPSKMRG